jgi:hypothetical protein
VPCTIIHGSSGSCVLVFLTSVIIFEDLVDAERYARRLHAPRSADFEAMAVEPRIVNLFAAKNGCKISFFSKVASPCGSPEAPLSGR